MTSTTIRSQLEQTAGVAPSEDWLTACQAHLRLTNEETVDAVLHQVFHADLRDVVRPSETNNNSATQNSSSSHMLLRNFLQQSMRGETRKATIPASFRLLVQVEELLDVSLNAEARYNLGPASATAPTPVGNQRSRLLKLYLSDGHLPPIHLIGMEAAPVPNLSVQSLAGIKVLLRGPLEIRHGLLQLHPSNAIVLGGSVAELIPIQRKALEQAQRLAGIGVDPTVKALCWNADEAANPEEDEGEAASGDVVAPRTMPQQPTMQPQRAAPFAQPPAPQRRPQAAQIIPPVPPRVQQTMPQQRQLPVPPYQQQGRSQPAPAQRQRTVSMPASSRNNPYARNTTSRTTTATTTPTSTVTPTSSTITPTSIIIESAARASAIISPDEAVIDSPRKENRSNNLPPSLTATTSTKTTATQSSQESYGGIREPLSFIELTSLVQRISQDRQLYEQHQDNVFVVPAKMKGQHLYFNIEKKKKKRKKTSKDDKYEYVMNSHFTGTGQQQLITVVVADDILRPHFHLAPGEMRQLSRTDRKASEKLVKAGGASVMAELSTLTSWEVCLYSTAEDFFAKPIPAFDKDDPILRVLKQSD
jgi:hypothetical protein